MEFPAGQPDTKAEFDAEALHRHYAGWRESMTAAGTGSRAAAEAAVERLYERTGKERPAILWCQSFYQMLTLPSLVVGILHSDMWQLVAGDSQASDKQWEAFWNKVWPEIWLNGGQPLLHGMNHTSRIAAYYGHLEEALISQAKREIGTSLRSGRFEYFQRRLKREMYRLYWARHELANDFAKEHYTHLKHDLFAEAVYVRNRNFDWPGWKELVPWDERVIELASGLDGLFNLLAMRLGGEPQLQSQFILNLPVGLDRLPTAELLVNAWPNEFEGVRDDLAIWLELSANASSVTCLDGLAFICEKPQSFYITPRRRLHNASGPALTYSDGFAEFAWEGVIVPRFVIEEPESITVEKIENSDNAEVRRVMLERYGTAQYIVDANIQPVHSDDYGTLYRKELPGDEPLVMVKVVNATAEPDGTYKDYFLRVPPTMQTAKEAVAWTFGLDADTYDPSVQT
jgi:hypothetical protein